MFLIDFYFFACLTGETTSEIRQELCNLVKSPPALEAGAPGASGEFTKVPSKMGEVWWILQQFMVKFCRMEEYGRIQAYQGMFMEGDIANL